MNQKELIFEQICCETVRDIFETQNEELIANVIHCLETEDFSNVDNKYIEMFLDNTLIYSNLIQEDCFLFEVFNRSEHRERLANYLQSTGKKTPADIHNNKKFKSFAFRDQVLNNYLSKENQAAKNIINKIKGQSSNSSKRVKSRLKGTVFEKPANLVKGTGKLAGKLAWTAAKPLRMATAAGLSAVANAQLKQSRNQIRNIRKSSKIKNRFTGKEYKNQGRFLHKKAKNAARGVKQGRVLRSLAKKIR